MRNREKYNILKNAIDKNKHLFIDIDKSNNDGRYTIKNGLDLFPAIDVIRKFEWGKIRNSKLRKKINRILRNQNFSNFSMNNEEYNHLLEWANSINNYLIGVVSVLSMSYSEQSDYSISVRLPTNNIEDLGQLNQFNDEIIEILQTLILSRYGGILQFGGFDKGSDWLELVITRLEHSKAVIAYASIIAIITITQEGLELRKKYYESEETRFSALIMKRKMDDNKNLQLSDLDDAEFEDYVEDLVKIKVREKIDELCSETELGPEDANSFAQAASKLEDHMKKGFEYHGCLNPPKGIIKSSNKEINYEELRKYLENKNQKNILEAIEDNSEENNGEESQETENDNE